MADLATAARMLVKTNRTFVPRPAEKALADALKKQPDVAVGPLLVPQDPLERLAYAMVGPLEQGVENGELSARDFTRQPEAEPQYAIAEGMGAVGLRVTKVAELGPALRQAQKLNAEGRTVLIDVKANVEDRRSRF